MSKYDYYFKRKKQQEKYKPIENIDNIVALIVIIPCCLAYLLFCGFGAVL